MNTWSWIAIAERCIRLEYSDKEPIDSQTKAQLKSIAIKLAKAVLHEDIIEAAKQVEHYYKMWH